MNLINKLKLKALGDSRGNLTAIEQERDVPFNIKRVYYLYGTQPNSSRGYHAHKELVQFAICISGSCRMVLDNGVNKKEVILNSATEGVFIDKMVWHEMHEFSQDCILLVLANDYYDEEDYIRDYAHFKGELGKINEK